MILSKPGLIFGIHPDEEDFLEYEDTSTTNGYRFTNLYPTDHTSPQTQRGTRHYDLGGRTHIESQYIPMSHGSRYTSNNSRVPIDRLRSHSSVSFVGNSMSGFVLIHRTTDCCWW
jgi:hypothetical protein